MTASEFPKFSIVFGEKGIREHTAVCLRNQFKECFGIEVELQPLPWKELFQRFSKGNYQISLIHSTGWVDDPVHFLHILRFLSEDHDFKFSHWMNEEFDRFLDLSEAEINPFQRSSHLLKAEEVLLREAPIIPLFYQPQQSIIREDIKGFFNEPSGTFDLAFSYHKKE